MSKWSDAFAFVGAMFCITLIATSPLWGIALILWALGD